MSDHGDSALDRITWLDLPGNENDPRKLTFVEFNHTAPFPIRRIYWIHTVSAGEQRGHHAHRNTQQLFIAVSGRFRIELDDGESSSEFLLDDPTRSLWVPAGLWREFEILDDHTAVLVLASTHFDEADYIRDYETFRQFSLARRAGRGRPEMS
jgi:dTDP-4-dehydrorhamnose 3,5-epimerase-like enzyme